MFTACLFFLLICAIYFFSDDSRKGIELQQITSMSRDLIDENNERPRRARVRPRSLSGDLDSAADISLIISPDVPEEPCTFSVERPLEEGSGPMAFG